MTLRPLTNGRTTLRARRRPAAPLSEFDCLPPELRRWLAGAVLPWSARSARRAWRQALDESRVVNLTVAEPAEIPSDPEAARRFETILVGLLLSMPQWHFQ